MSQNQSLLDTIVRSIPPINKEGWPFIFIFAIVALILCAFSTTLGWLGWIATAWCAFFFRDPIRTVPTREGLLVSPGDGRVQKITVVPPPKELDMGETPRTRISIFLNVFDVHVNRIPIAGTVSELNYFPGKFLNAELDKASEDNERQHIRVTMKDGRDIAVVQIAGLIARRIVCQLKEGQTVATGERLGLIRFGSRVDVYLPEGATPLVVVGQYAIGGETVLADLKSTESARTGTLI